MTKTIGVIVGAVAISAMAAGPVPAQNLPGSINRTVGSNKYCPGKDPNYLPPALRWIRERSIGPGAISHREYQRRRFYRSYHQPRSRRFAYPRRRTPYRPPRYQRPYAPPRQAYHARPPRPGFETPPMPSGRYRPPGFRGRYGPRGDLAYSPEPPPQMAYRPHFAGRPRWARPVPRDPAIRHLRRQIRGTRQALRAELSRPYPNEPRAFLLARRLRMLRQRIWHRRAVIRGGYSRPYFNRW